LVSVAEGVVERLFFAVSAIGGAGVVGKERPPHSVNSFGGDAASQQFGGRAAAAVRCRPRDCYQEPPPPPPPPPPENPPPPKPLEPDDAGCDAIEPAVETVKPSMA
jgi:hypothetical protein